MARRCPVPPLARRLRPPCLSCGGIAGTGAGSEARSSISVLRPCSTRHATGHGRHGASHPAHNGLRQEKAVVQKGSSEAFDRRGDGGVAVASGACGPWGATSTCRPGAAHYSVLWRTRW